MQHNNFSKDLTLLAEATNSVLMQGSKGGTIQYPNEPDASENDYTPTNEMEDEEDVVVDMDHGYKLVSYIIEDEDSRATIYDLVNPEGRNVKSWATSGRLKPSQVMDLAQQEIEKRLND